MAALPTIGALWIGGSLTWLEQLCLTSFVAHGHEVRLFTYGDVRHVPDGVKVCDGREILDTAQFIVHDRTQSVALFSDLFRFHLIKNDPGIIYVDTDVFCLRPLIVANPYLFGYEAYNSPTSWRINGAILRLPEESRLLSNMLEFMENEHPAPNWIPRRFRAEMRERAAAGNPMHVSEMPWGIWGPLGISAFARETGEWEHAQAVDVLYPVPFPDRRLLLRRPMKTLEFLTENSLTIHMWAPIKKVAANRHNGLCPPNSYVGQQLDRFGIDASKAPVPITKRRETVFE